MHPNRQQRRRHHQRQDGWHAEAEDHRRGELLPPERRGAVDRVIAARAAKSSEMPNIIGASPAIVVMVVSRTGPDPLPRPCG